MFVHVCSFPVSIFDSIYLLKFVVPLTAEFNQIQNDFLCLELIFETKCKESNHLQQGRA